MKTLLATVVLVLLTVMLAFPARASVGDTLVVYASSGNLEEIITKDTTGTGAQKHSVYKLVSLDTTYIFQGPIAVNSDITVIGVPDPVTGRPPCIQPMMLGPGELPDFLFVLNGPHTNAVFKNLYFTGRSTDNTICTTNYNGAGAIIQVAGPNIRLTVDNVVFSDWPTNNIGYSGDHTSIFVTNCKFRNSTVSTAWYSGEAVRNTFNTAITDTLIMRNNTMFCIAYSAACPVTVNPCSYFEFTHNSVIHTFKNPFWIFNITTGKVNDNLFYSAFSGGSSLTEHFGMWDQLRTFAITGVVDFDTLNLSIADWFDPADSALATNGILWPAEAKRNIEFKNNNCFWPTAVTQFWHAWNDTAHVDSVVTPVWVNERTLGMFADKVHWPHLTMSGNREVDPQFGPTIDQVLYKNTGCGDGFFEHFTAVRRNDAGVVTTYGYKLETVTAGYWVPTWPLPETADLHYANAVLQTGGTDGLPVGDPYWITGHATAVPPTPATVAHRFALENAYPNPFNPSTTVRVSLPTAGPASLKIYNTLGQLVQVVDQGFKQAGEYTYRVDLSRNASGVYFATLQQGGNVMTKKLALVR